MESQNKQSLRLSLFTEHNVFLRFIRVAHNQYFFYCRVELLHVDILHVIYTFIGQWTFRLPPYFGYCGLCCYEHLCMSLCGHIFHSLRQIPRNRIARLYGISKFNILKSSFPKWLHHFTFLPAMMRVPIPHIITKTYHHMFFIHFLVVMNWCFPYGFFQRQLKVYLYI